MLNYSSLQSTVHIDTYVLNWEPQDVIHLNVLFSPNKTITPQIFEYFIHMQHIIKLTSRTLPATKYSGNIKSQDW